MSLGVHLLLVHEMPGVGQDERYCVEFDVFFDGRTPEQLLRAGIYGEVAVPFKGGPWRRASMVMLAHAIGKMTQHNQVGNMVKVDKWIRQSLLFGRDCFGCCFFVLADCCSGGATSRRKARVEQFRLSALAATARDEAPGEDATRCCADARAPASVAA